MVQIREQLMIEPMREADVPAVQIIERDIFSTPWPRNAYYRELASRNSAHYIVLRRQGGPAGKGLGPAVGWGGSPPEQGGPAGEGLGPAAGWGGSPPEQGGPAGEGLGPAAGWGGSPPERDEIVGYAGMWRMYDEAHVTTIGVRHDMQHSGYGRVLFAALVQAAYDMGAKWVTLEVRTSNENAMKMYEAFGFKVIGRRKGYYTDNGEDAIVMWSDSIYSPRFRRAFEENLGRIQTDVQGLRRDLLPPAE